MRGRLRPWMLLLVGVAMAQPWIHRARGADDKVAAQAARADVIDKLTKGQIGANDLDNYFSKFVFPAVLGNDPKQVEKWPAHRKDLKVLFSRAKDGPAHDVLNKFLLDRMTKLVVAKEEALGEYASVIRVNAMLTIGDLNQVEGEGGKPPKPLPDAWKTLWGAYKSPTVKDYLRVAALVGIKRFAECEAPEATQNPEVTKLLLEELSRSEPPEGRSKNVHDWMRRQAADILATIGNPGEGYAVAKAMMKILEDSKNDTIMRCEMAVNLGRLKMDSADAMDWTAVANSTARMMVETCNKEFKRMEVSRIPNPRGILYPVDSALAALGKPATSTGGGEGILGAIKGSPHEKHVAKLQSAIKSMHVILDAPDIQPRALFGEIQPKVDEVQQLLPPPSRRGGRGDMAAGNQ